jgi:hypothetical protein
MTTRQTRFSLQAVSIALLLAAAIAVLSAVWPAGPESLAGTGAAAPRRKPAAAPVASPALDELAAVWDRRLQGPLHDTPQAMPMEEVILPVEEQPAGDSADPAVVTLVGTMREEGRSLAIFLRPGGRIDIKQAGESIELPEGVMRLDKIESSQVTLSNDAGSMTMRFPAAGVQ